MVFGVLLMGPDGLHLSRASSKSQYYHMTSATYMHCWLLSHSMDSSTNIPLLEFNMGVFQNSTRTNGSVAKRRPQKATYHPRQIKFHRPSIRKQHALGKHPRSTRETPEKQRGSSGEAVGKRWMSRKGKEGKGTERNGKEKNQNRYCIPSSALSLHQIKTKLPPIVLKIIFKSTTNASWIITPPTAGK